MQMNMPGSGELKLIENRLVELLKEKGMKVSCAESLTGGLVSKLITDVPGASTVFECGVCSYSNRIKHEVLGVSDETLSSCTEYSEECASEMAEGVRRLSGADIGISTTGIAGPGGGTEEKPVGTVYVGISTKNVTMPRKLYLGELGTREEIRRASALCALFLCYETLREL